MKAALHYIPGLAGDKSPLGMALAKVSSDDWNLPIDPAVIQLPVGSSIHLGERDASIVFQVIGHSYSRDHDLCQIEVVLHPKLDSNVSSIMFLNYIKGNWIKGSKIYDWADKP